ncbi:MAG: hypothetical protein JXA78_15550 [Anaerolineales bacterium]|nr:hypothetical protein [Anaerolineales bacterium]
MADDYDPERKAGEQAWYWIRVQGELDSDWSNWFNGMTVELESEEPAVSLLIGEVADQASLRGLLNRIWDLNLSLISLNRVGDDPNKRGDSEIKEKEHDNALHSLPG